MSTFVKKDMEIRQVYGYEGLYEVSEFGNVYSVEKEVVSGARYSIIRKYARREKNVRDNRGYKRTTLCKNGVCKTISIHRLVANAFCEGDKNLVVNHKDGNKLNNHYSNLEFITNSNNLKHAWENGLIKPSKKKVGSTHSKSKLTDAQVREIRKSDLSCRKLADVYKVHHSIINGIKLYKRYFNVK